MNSTNNNSFEIAAKKVFSDLYALIKEDEKETENKIDNNKKDKNVISNKIDNKNVISNEIDDKPKQVNSLEQINVLDDKIKPFNLLDLIGLSSISFVVIFSSSFIKLYKSLNTFLAAISKELLFVEFIL